MRTISAWAVCTYALSGACAINLVEPRDVAPKVVLQPIHRSPVTNPLQRDRERLARRQSNVVNVPLRNEGTLYYMNVSIGTPEQVVQLHLDTGSSDLWVNTPSSAFCETQNQCVTAGTYTANDSSTYRYLNSDFNITYVDGSGSEGDYVTDTVRFGGVELPDQQMGIGYESSSTEGILGIGYAINEVAVVYNRGSPYANVPQKLVQQGHINTNAYSLWLNDLDSSAGSILFGGVNTAKYTGSLSTVPIIKESGVYAEFVIALTAVGINGNKTSIASNVAIPALLDSGSSLTYLPEDIAQSIYQATGAQYDAREGAAFINCNRANSGTTVEFTFSNPTITVDMSELVIPIGYTSGGRLVCILGIIPAGSLTPVLGDTFLRSAYVVYDLQNNAISLAQTRFNSTDDDIQEITNAGSVPDATTVSNAVTSVPVQTGGARNGGLPTVTLTDGAPAATPAASYNIAMVGAIGAGLLMMV